MRICYLSTCKSVHSLKWFQWFKNRGHDISIVTFHPPSKNGQSLPQGVRVHEIGDTKPFLSKVGPVRKLVGDEAPDILHAHQVIGYGMWGALSKRHPFVVSAWGTDVEILAQSSFFNRQMAKHVMGKAEKVHVPARCMAGSVRKLGCPDEKIFTQVIGTDIENFHPRKSNPELRKSIGGSHIITSIRMLRPVYDVRTLVRAAPDVLNKFPESRFLLIGEGPEMDNLKTEAQSLGVEKSVIFAGAKTSFDMPEYLASSDIFVDTLSSSAGVSIGLLEAMASGAAPVVANIPGADEAIKDRENGLLFPPSDHKTLSDHLINLLSDDSARKEMGKSARKTAEDIGDIEKCMARIEAMYESLLKK